MPGGARVFEDDFNPNSRKLERGEADADGSVFLPTNEKENNRRENNVAKIKVVVCQYFLETSSPYIYHICIASFLHFKTCRKIWFVIIIAIFFKKMLFNACLRYGKGL